MKKLYNVLQLALVVVLLSAFGNVNAQYTSLYEVDFTDAGLTIYDPADANTQWGASMAKLYQMGIMVDDGEGNMISESDWIGSNQKINGLNNWYLHESGEGMYPANWRGANLMHAPIGTWQEGYAVKFTVDLYVNQLSKHITDGIVDGELPTPNQMVFGLTERRPNEGHTVNAPDQDGPNYTSDFNIGIGIDATANIGELKVYLTNNTGTSLLLSDLNITDKLRFVYTATKSSADNTFDVVLEVQKDNGGVFESVNSSPLTASITQSLIYHSDGTLLAFGSYNKLDKIKYDSTGDGTLDKTFSEPLSTTLWSYLKLEKGDIPNSITGGAKSLSQEMSVYPNPVSSTLFVNNIADDETVSVYSATGALVVSVRATANVVSVDVASLPSGVYIVKAGTQTTRVVKK